MGEIKEGVIFGLIIGLFVCSVIDGVKLARLEADVEFLTAVSEQSLRSADRG